MLELTRNETETVRYALEVFLDSIRNEDTRGTLFSDIERAKSILAQIDNLEYWAIFTWESGYAEECEWTPIFASETEALAWIGEGEFTTEQIA